MAAFLVKMSELTPKVVLKQMVYLQEQIDSEAYISNFCHLSYQSVLHHSLRNVGSNCQFDHINRLWRASGKLAFPDY
jgi:hypothetical protein